MHRFGPIVALLALVSGLVACTPAGPTSVLPSGVSVEWERDTGGTTDAFGNYTPAWSTSITNATATTGPTPGGVRTPPPTAFAFFGGLLPDGSARYPWNGYAGESILMASAPGATLITFPGGSCSMPGGDFDTIRGVAPSPDGTRAAEITQNNEVAQQTTTAVIIVSLQNTAGRCPTIVKATYVETTGSFPSGSHANNAAVVWKPDSSAIAYQEDPQGNLGFGPASIDRLDALAGATPTTIIAATAPGTPGCRTPLGWSVADRLLVTCWSFPLVAPLTITSTLETVPSTGGARRVLDTATLRRQVTSDFELFDHYGYFVPGTDTVIYNSGATTAGSGPTFPAFQIRTIADQSGATSSPFVAPVTAFHNEGPVGGGAAVAVPNPDLVDRFGH